MLSVSRLVTDFFFLFCFFFFFFFFLEGMRSQTLQIKTGPPPWSLPSARSTSLHASSLSPGIIWLDRGIRGCTARVPRGESKWSRVGGWYLACSISPFPFIVRWHFGSCGGCPVALSGGYHVRRHFHCGSNYLKQALHTRMIWSRTSTGVVTWRYLFAILVAGRLRASPKFKKSTQKLINRKSGYVFFKKTADYNSVLTKMRFSSITR